MSKEAENIVKKVLADALSPGIPPSYRCILRAKFLRKGRRPVINADLEMFDGLSASVQAQLWDHGWSHRWVSMEGASIWWNGEKWQRESDKTTEDLPLFMEQAI